MKRIFFTLCALAVTITLIYHFFPGTAHTAYVLPINGAGMPITWLACIGLLGGVVYYRALGKAH